MASMLTCRKIAPIATIILAAVFWALPISVQPSPTTGVTISADQAQAYTYGRHRRIYRRTYRRAYRHHYYYHHRHHYY